MSTTKTPSLTLTLVKDVVAESGRHENWQHPFHVVRWVNRPPTREWFYAAFGQRKAALRLAEACGGFTLDIRSYVLERAKALMVADACLNPGNGLTADRTVMAIQAIIESLEHAW